MYTSFTEWDTGLYLAHHGIKGQKWGVRRYQNPDGTLTEEGKRRNAKDIQKHGQRDDKKGLARLKKTDVWKEAVDKTTKSRDAYLKAKRDEFRIMRGYADDEKLVDKYQRKYAGELASKYSWDFSRALDWIKYDDGDQGQCFKLYLDDHKQVKQQLDAAEKRSIDAWKKYVGQLEKVADRLLGSYGNTPIAYGKYKYNTTIGNRLVSEMARSADDMLGDEWVIF